MKVIRCIDFQIKSKKFDWALTHITRLFWVGKLGLENLNQLNLVGMHEIDIASISTAISTHSNMHPDNTGRKRERVMYDLCPLIQTLLMERIINKNFNVYKLYNT